MSIKGIIALLLGLLSFKKLCAQESIITGCSADMESPPFLIKNSDDTYSGVWPAIVKDAVNNLMRKYPSEKEYSIKTVILHSMPWLGCLEKVKNGEIDFAMLASFKPDRSTYMDYPKGAVEEKLDCSSESKFQCSGYTLITFKSQSNNYVFDGDLKKIPQPIRIPKGYSITEELLKRGLEVDTARNMEANVKMLARDKGGSAIVFSETVDYFKDIFTNQLVFHKHELVKKSYYISFSKKTHFSQNFKRNFWKETNHLRKNKEYYLRKIAMFLSEG